MLRISVGTQPALLAIEYFMKKEKRKSRAEKEEKEEEQVNNKGEEDEKMGGKGKERHSPLGRLAKVTRQTRKSPAIS